MSRVTLTNSPGWFDDAKATKFKEATRHDGNNFISRATGSQWDHEDLYYTRNGRWVLNSYSAWQGSLETYEEIGEAEAVAWLISQERTQSEQLEQLPAKVRESVARWVRGRRGLTPTDNERDSIQQSPITGA